MLSQEVEISIRKSIFRKMQARKNDVRDAFRMNIRRKCIARGENAVNVSRREWHLLAHKIAVIVKFSRKRAYG